MRTSGSGVNDGHPGSSACLWRSSKVKIGLCGCCRLLLPPGDLIVKIGMPGLGSTQDIGRGPRVQSPGKPPLTATYGP